MDLRDLINKLDSINEAEEYDVEAGKKLNQEKWNFAEKQAHLYGLLQQLRNLVNQTSTAPTQGASTTPTGNTQSKWQKDVAAQKGLTTDIAALSNLDPNVKYARSIKESLISSFEKDFALNEETSFIKKVGGKLMLPLAIATEMWDAWTKIKELPEDMPIDEKKKEITKIIGEQVARFGVFTVGAAMGAILGGTIGGPVALVTGIAGGVAAEYQFGDSSDKLVDWVINQLYPSDSTSSVESETSVEIPNVDELMKNAVEELQRKLIEAGFDVGKTGVDGKFGTNTMNALQSYKQSSGVGSDIEAILKLIDFSAELQEGIPGLGFLKNLFKKGIKPGDVYKSKKSGKQYRKTEDGWEDIATGKKVNKGTANSLDTAAAEEQLAADNAAKAAKAADNAEKSAAKAKKAKEIAEKVPASKSAFDSLKASGKVLGTIWNSAKFLALIGALSRAGYYLWDKSGDLSSGAASGSQPAAVDTQPAAGGAATTTPGPTQPAQAQGQTCSKEVTDLVNQIKLDISQLKMITDPSIAGDAKKAIAHAEQTLQIYAPGC